MNKNRFSINGQFSLVNGNIGENTIIWNYVNIMAGANIGASCTISDYVFIESGVTIGNDVVIKMGVELCKGVTIEDAVFIGPGVVFLNDRYPRSKYIKQVEAGYSPDTPYAIQENEWLEKTLVKKGSTIGANATILCGITIGEMSTIGAGSVVVKDVPPFCTAVGNPARIIKKSNDK